MPLIAWILLAALVAALVAAAVLWLLLRRAEARNARTEEVVAQARREVRAAAEEETAEQVELLRVAITRAHADAMSAYANEERRISDQRRGELTIRERELSDRLAEMVAA